MVCETEVHGKRHIVLKCMKHIPNLFAGSVKANVEKASRWWKVGDKMMALKMERTQRGNETSLAGEKIRRANFKAVRRKGQKQSALVKALYLDLRSELELLRAEGLKFSASVFKTHEIAMVTEANEGSIYHSSLKFGGKPISSKITNLWVQPFMRHQKIVLRAQTGKFQVSP